MNPVSAWGYDTANAGSRIDSLVQEAPPSVVRRMIPDRPSQEIPTANPVFPSANATPVRLRAFPYDWIAHVVAPSVVLRIVPYCPTRIPVSALVKQAPMR